MGEQNGHVWKTKFTEDARKWQIVRYFHIAPLGNIYERMMVKYRKRKRNEWYSKEVKRRNLV